MLSFKCKVKRYCGTSMILKNLRCLVEWELDGRRMDEMITFSIMDQNFGDIKHRSGHYIGMDEVKLKLELAHDYDV